MSQTKKAKPIRLRRHRQQQLLLGSDALKLVLERIDLLRQEIEMWAALTVSTDG